MSTLLKCLCTGTRAHMFDSRHCAKVLKKGDCWLIFNCFLCPEPAFIPIADLACPWILFCSGLLTWPSLILTMALLSTHCWPQVASWPWSWKLLIADLRLLPDHDSAAYSLLTSTFLLNIILASVQLHICLLGCLSLAPFSLFWVLPIRSGYLWSGLLAPMPLCALSLPVTITWSVWTRPVREALLSLWPLTRHVIKHCGVKRLISWVQILVIGEFCLPILHAHYANGGQDSNMAFHPDEDQICLWFSPMVDVSYCCGIVWQKQGRKKSGAFPVKVTSWIKSHPGPELGTTSN